MVNVAMDPTLVMNGTFGKVYSSDGEWLTNVQSAEANGALGKEEIKRSGNIAVGHKVMSITYSGTMTGFRVTSKLAKQIAQVKDDGKTSFVTELVMKLDDPDNPDGKTWVRLKGVQFDTIPILKFEAGATVMEETPFTFSDFEYL